MGYSLNNNEESKRELLDEWHDVYGVNENYGFSINDESDEIDNVTIGFSALSLKEKQEVEILLAFRPDEFCYIVEEFLNVYNDLYLNYILDKVIDE